MLVVYTNFYILTADIKSFLFIVPETQKSGMGILFLNVLEISMQRAFDQITLLNSTTFWYITVDLQG